MMGRISWVGLTFGGKWYFAMFLQLVCFTMNSNFKIRTTLIIGQNWSLTEVVFTAHMWGVSYIPIFTSIGGEWWHVRDGWIRGFLRQASGTRQHSPVQPFDRSTLSLLSALCCEQQAARSLAFTLPPGSGSLLSSNREDRERGRRKGRGDSSPKKCSHSTFMWMDRWMDELPVERVRKKKRVRESERERGFGLEVATALFKLF